MNRGPAGRRIIGGGCALAFILIVVLCTGANAQEAAAKSAVPATERFIAPDGKATNAGTKDSPWDIAALDGSKKIAPGTTVWMRGGLYRHPDRSFSNHGFSVRLAGTKEKPIVVRAMPGERVTLDGGLVVQQPSTYLWLRDLEITVSDPRPVEPVPPPAAGWGKYIHRPWGGLNVYSGKGCKFINLVIHDNCQGVSWWVGSSDSEMYGCLIYDNGFWGTDRGHGHAIYTQNKDGVKTIADCIMTGGYGWTMHAYGSSSAYVDNYLIEGNIAYDGGQFLVGGGRPSNNIRVLKNYLYNVNMRIGYSAPYNVDCIVRDNVVANNAINIVKYKKVVKEGNLEVPPSAARPKTPLIVLRPNKYDPRRANLAIVNWPRRLVVQVDAAAFLKDGDRYVLKDPKHFFGDPVHWGACEKGRIAVPMFGREFAAFVVLKEE